MPNYMHNRFSSNGNAQFSQFGSVQFSSAQSVLTSFQAAHIAANLLLSHNLHCPMGENNVTKWSNAAKGY